MADLTPLGTACQPMFARPGDGRVCVSFSEAARSIRNGDIILAPWIPLVGYAGRSRYGHAGMLAWWRAELMLLEFYVWGQAIPFRARVDYMPGTCDVYRANAGGRWPEWKPGRAVDKMLELLEQPLGWRSTLEAALAHLPLLCWAASAARWLPGPGWYEAEDESNRPPQCTEAIAIADEAGGVDPVPHLARRLTEPADLARSPFYEYLFTVFPDDREE